MGFSRKQLAENPTWAKIFAEADAPQKRKRPAGPQMNGTETAYSQRLKALVAAGEVKSWMFNAMRLRIAMGEKVAYYKPDFFVEYFDGHFEFHETKGHEKARGILALKVAAGMFPIRFVLAKRDDDGGWTFEDFGKAAE